jgi:electron transfer flavoprotein beta subunit
MNILVCVKQVPDTDELKLNTETNVLVRDGVTNVLNPYDSYALEAAARIKDADPDTKIVVLSMGPEQAKAALKECLAIAADKAYQVTDAAFAGSDTLGTGYILAKAIAKVEETEGKFDAIFCGKQSADGDNAQVGPELAERLGYAQVTGCLEAEKTEDGLKLVKEVEAGTDVIGVKTPCLATFDKPAWDPRYPTIKRKLAANKAAIPVLTGADLADVDGNKVGAKGAVTKVKVSFAPAKKEGGVRIQEEDGAASGLKLFGELHAAGVI